MPSLPHQLPSRWVISRSAGPAARRDSGSPAATAVRTPAAAPAAPPPASPGRRPGLWDRADMRWLALLCCVTCLRSAWTGPDRMPAAAPSWGVVVPSRWRGKQAVGGSWGAFVKSQRRGDVGAGQSWALPVSSRAKLSPQRRVVYDSVPQRTGGTVSPSEAAPDPLRGSASQLHSITVSSRDSVYGTSRTAPFYASLQPGSGLPLAPGGPLPEALNLTFTAGGLQHRLTLRRAPSVLDPTFLVLRRGANFTSLSALDDSSEVQSCLYRGEVSRTGLAEPGWAALDLCRHLTGAMRLGGEDLILGRFRPTPAAPAPLTPPSSGRRRSVA